METLYDIRKEKLKLDICYALMGILGQLNYTMQNIDLCLDTRVKYRKLTKEVSECFRLVDLYLKAYKKLEGTSYTEEDFKEVREFFACLIK